MTIKAGAWAVIRRNEILIRTVMDSERGAMVNWLVNEGVMVYNTMSDDDIKQAFYRSIEKYDIDHIDVVVRQVLVTMDE